MASQEVETVSPGLDKAKLFAAAGLVVASLVGYYLLAAQGPWVQWGVLLACLAGAVAVFFTAEPGRELVAYGRDSYREMSKVVWPERKEAIQMTLFVFGFAIVMALFMWLADKTIEWVFYDLILGWRK